MKRSASRTRDLGTVTKMDPGSLTVRLDSDDQRSVTFDPRQMRHFDHGYAVTSHSSLGLTTGRVIANMDGETARALINTRLAYLAISRASKDARIYTNDATTLGQRLATDISKTAAVDVRRTERVYTAADSERHHAPLREALEPADAAQFKWKAETGTIQTYQHVETGRNIHIDGEHGQFYAQGGRRTTQDVALDRTMSAGREHSQNERENSRGLVC